MWYIDLKHEYNWQKRVKNGKKISVSTQFILDNLRPFSLWLFRCVAVSVCGRLVLWSFRFVAVPACGRFGLWPFRSVTLSVCGRFGFGCFGLWLLWPETIHVFLKANHVMYEPSNSVSVNWNTQQLQVLFLYSIHGNICIQIYLFNKWQHFSYAQWRLA